MLLLTFGLAIYFIANRPRKLIDDPSQQYFLASSKKKSGKMRLQHRYFPVNFAKFLTTGFFKNTFSGYFRR